MTAPRRFERNRSAGVIVFLRSEAGCEFLLLLSRLTKRPLWEFPKGGIDGQETPLQAALRELHEETSLAGDAIRLVPGFERTESYRFSVGREGGERVVVRKEVTYFLAEAFRREVQVSAAETSAYAWLPLEEAVRRVRYPGRRRMLQEAAAAAGCGSLTPRSHPAAAPPAPAPTSPSPGAGRRGRRRR